MNHIPEAPERIYVSVDEAGDVDALSDQPGSKPTSTRRRKDGMAEGDTIIQGPQWVCSCRYFNTGPVCTHCGRVPQPFELVLTPPNQVPDGLREAARALSDSAQVMEFGQTGRKTIVDTDALIALRAALDSPPDPPEEPND